MTGPCQSHGSVVAFILEQDRPVPGDDYLVLIQLFLKRALAGNFFNDLARRRPAIRCLVFIGELRREFLHEEILRVGFVGSSAPGDAVVSSIHDAGHTGDGDTAYLKISRGQGAGEPEIGVAQLRVTIESQEAATGIGGTTGDDPAVASDAWQTLEVFAH